MCKKGLFQKNNPFFFYFLKPKPNYNRSGTEIKKFAFGERKVFFKLTVNLYFCAQVSSQAYYYHTKP
jgi:hypothetical protein